MTAWRPQSSDDPTMSALSALQDGELGPVVAMVLRIEDLRLEGYGFDRIAELMAIDYPDPPGGEAWTAATVERVLSVVDSMRQGDAEGSASGVARPQSALATRQPQGTTFATPAPDELIVDDDERGRPWWRLPAIAAGVLALAAASAGATIAVIERSSGNGQTVEEAADSAAPLAPTTSLNPADTMAIRIETPLTEESDPGGSNDAPAGAASVATATIREDGRLYLEGTFRSQDEADAFLEEAGGVFGRENIVESYSIDPAAPDPKVADVALDKPVLFKTGEATIDPSFIPFLEACAGVLKLNPHIVMSVSGYTDSIGPAEFNLELSIARAQAIVDFYRDMDIDDSQLIAVGYGEEAPAADNDSDEGREQNRRAMLQLLNVMNNEG